MIDGYTAFLAKFAELYPELYIKVIEFPDAVIAGWINSIREDRDFITFRKPEKVKNYFETLLEAHRKSDFQLFVEP